MFDQLYKREPIGPPKPYTPRPRGGKRSRHIPPVLTHDEVYEIRAKRRLGALLKVLAFEYEVSMRTIKCVVYKWEAYEHY